MDEDRKHQEKPIYQTLLHPPQEDGMLFWQIFEHSTEAVLVLNQEGIVKFVNPAAEDLFDKSDEQMVGLPFGLPIYEGDEPHELDIVCPGKDSRVAEMRVTEIKLYGERLSVVSLHDITELARLREELREMSPTDELTGLYNRRGFLLFAQQQLKIADGMKQQILLLFVNLDNMRDIHDTLGDQEGNSALIETANLLRETFRASDIIARIGETEFVVLAIGARERHVEILKSRFQTNVAARNAQGNCRCKLSVCVGVTCYHPECPCSIDELMAKAKASMEIRAEREPVTRRVKRDRSNPIGQNLVHQFVNPQLR